MLTNEQSEQVLRVSLAALLHDVGKFAQRAEADPERYRSLSNLHEFAVTGADGRTRYHHAAYTWQFIEEHMPWLISLGGREGNVAQQAARHHNPSTVWDAIVAESDRLSAGMDRGHPDEYDPSRGWAHVQIARLTPVVSRVTFEPSGKSADGLEVPFKPLGMADEIFPVEREDERTQSEAVGEYRGLFDGFVRAVEQIPGGSLPRFFETFLSVYERYAWCIPAATNSSPRDVSLIEHSRAASAIAAALACQLIAEGKLDFKAAGDRGSVRYLMAVGDLSGIQAFLYTIVAEKAARALRGRSLALQLVADAIAQTLLRELQLPPTTLLYNGAGKMWLLLPIAVRDQALSLTEQIDVSLQQTYGGRLAFTLGFAELSGSDFVQKRVAEKWHAAARDMQSRRRNRFSTLMRESYDQVFSRFGDPADVCRVCGNLSSDIAPVARDEERRACPECREFVKIGGVVTRTATIIRFTGHGWEKRLHGADVRLGGRPANQCRFELPTLDAAYLLSDASPSQAADCASESDVVLSINQPPDSYAGRAAVSMWALGLSRPQTTAGEPIDFDGLAERSQGIRRLGILRMDVDSLGRIFREGLPNQERTISRITNLSKNLTYFFAGYLSHLVEKPDFREHAQIIYAGGDDIFVVGSWSEIPRLARKIRKEFGRFSGENPTWGISAGVAIVPPKFPLAAAARRAAESESRAKNHKREGEQAKHKDAIGLLGDALGWEEFRVTRAMQESLTPMFTRDEAGGSPMRRAVLRRLIEIARVYRDSVEELRRTRGHTCSLSELQNLVRRGKWVWQAAYAVARWSGDAQARETLRQIVTALGTKRWMEYESPSDLIWLLRPATAWADFLTRQERDHDAKG